MEGEARVAKPRNSRLKPGHLTDFRDLYQTIEYSHERSFWEKSIFSRV